MKLDGLRILDLSMFLPGPHLTMMMADHGADVIKVEPPVGEPVRNVGYKTDDGVSVWFRNTHRGKRSAVLDLKQEAGLQALLKLVETADGVDFAGRPIHPDVGRDPNLPDDTRLWAALQQASGGTWAGSIYDVEKIVAVIEAGLEARKIR